MSKLTIEQIKKINNGCSNGFSFDRSYFLFHNEKTLKKNILLTKAAAMYTSFYLQVIMARLQPGVHRELFLKKIL